MAFVPYLGEMGSRFQAEYKSGNITQDTYEWVCKELFDHRIWKQTDKRHLLMNMQFKIRNQRMQLEEMHNQLANLQIECKKLRDASRSQSTARSDGAGEEGDHADPTGK